MILIIPLYKIRVPKRLEEIKFNFLKNLNNKNITEIIVFFEDYELDQNYNFLIHPKTTIIECKERQTYDIMIDYSLKHYDKNEIIIIANADILFDNTISRLNEINFTSKKVCMLTRWDILKQPNNKMKFKLVLQKEQRLSWSFDCLIFNTNVEIDTSKLKIMVGVSGCDSYLLQKLREQNVTVINPCLDVRTYHFHFEDTDRISRPQGLNYWDMKDYNPKTEGIIISTVDQLSPNIEYILEEC